MTLSLDDLWIADGKRGAAVETATQTAGVDWTVGSVAELTVTLADRDHRLAAHHLTRLGTHVRLGDDEWRVGAVDRQYGAFGAMTTVRARSILARRLRSTAKNRVHGQVSAHDWIIRAVTDAGGTAVVQPSAARVEVAQTKGQTVLDVIASLCSDQQWEWAEYGGRFIAGTGWWARNGGHAPRVWPLTWKRDGGGDILAVETVVTDDDRAQDGALTLVLPYDTGIRVRPWHMLSVSGLAGGDNGDWLVQSVKASIARGSTVTVDAYRPLKPAPRATSPLGSGGAVGQGGEAFAALAAAEARKGWQYVDVGADEAVSDRPRGLDCADFTYRVAYLYLGKRPPSPFLNQSQTQLAYCEQAGRMVSLDEGIRTPGALLFKRTSPGAPGHVAISLGDGRTAESHRSGTVTSVSPVYRPSFTNDAGLPAFVFGGGSG